MSDSLYDEVGLKMQAHMQTVLATCDEAIAIRRAPYKGKYGGSRPCTIGHWIDSTRPYVKTGNFAVTHVRANWTEYVQRGTISLADFDSWLARVGELFALASGTVENGKVVPGITLAEIADAPWRSFYDDELSPPDAIGAYCEDEHDLPPDIAAQMAEVCGDWIIVGSYMQSLLDMGERTLPWQEWLTCVDRMWVYLDGDGAFVSPEMLAGMKVRFQDGKFPAEALGFYIYDRCMNGSMPPARAARYLNALRAGTFDIPGYQETGRYCPREDREYTKGSLGRLAR